MRILDPGHILLMTAFFFTSLPAEARLSKAFCSELRGGATQMNAMLPRTVSSPDKGFLESTDGVEKMVFLDTDYLKVDVDCEEEAVIYYVRFTSSELEQQLKADKKQADSAFYDMHNNQILMACRPEAFIKKFGLKQEVRTLLDRAGEVWHRWVTSSYDCL